MYQISGGKESEHQDDFDPDLDFQIPGKRFETPIDIKDVPKPGTYNAFLESKCDDIIEMIICGFGSIDIANHFRIPVSSYFYWKRKSPRLEEVKQAMIDSMEVLTDFALKSIKNAEGKDTPEILRITNQAKYIGWLASQRAPKEYGKGKEREIPPPPPVVQQEVIKGNMIMNEEQFNAFMDRIEAEAEKRRIEESKWEDADEV